MLKVIPEPPDVSEQAAFDTIVGISLMKDKILNVAGDLLELRAVATMCALYLNQQTTLGVKELANILGTSRPIISRNVDSLIEREFVTKRHDQEDKRLVSLHLTTDGAEWAASFLDRVGPVLK